MEEFDKVYRVTATMQVVNSIRDAITSGRLKVGDRLPPEAEMAKSLGVGRSSFREGMRILAAYGVVEIRQGEGTYIVDRMAEQFLEFMGFFPNIENMHHMLGLRQIIEVGNIMELHGKITEEEIQTIASINQKMSKSTSMEEAVRLDVEFHHTLIGYSKNPLLIQINEMITRIRIELLRILFYRQKEIEDAALAHKKIIDALHHGEVSDSVAAVKEHLSTTEESMKRIKK